MISSLLSICRARKTSTTDTEKETLQVNMLISALQGTASLHSRVWLNSRGAWIFGQNIFERVGGCANCAAHLWMTAEQDVQELVMNSGWRISTKSKASSAKKKCVQGLQPGKAEKVLDNKCGRSLIQGDSRKERADWFLKLTLTSILAKTVQVFYFQSLGLFFFFLF